jgi:hypothetical protein
MGNPLSTDIVAPVWLTNVGVLSTVANVTFDETAFTPRRTACNSPEIVRRIVGNASRTVIINAYQLTCSSVCPSVKPAHAQAKLICQRGLGTISQIIAVSLRPACFAISTCFAI